LGRPHGPHGHERHFFREGDIWGRTGRKLGMTMARRGHDTCGELHDQGDAKGSVIRGQLRGHNDTPFGRPTPSRPIGRPGVGRLLGIFGVFS
jgi:hypothetical protein